MITSTLTPLQQLAAMKAAHQRQQYPNIPPAYLPKPKYTDSTANALTKCVIDFIRFSGGQAERTGNQGRIIDTRKKVSDCIGRTGMIGSITRIKSSGTNGTSDLSITYKSLSIKCEIKIGADRQSEAQKQYQRDIEQAGGTYMIVRSFADFYQQFNKLFMA